MTISKLSDIISTTDPTTGVRYYKSKSTLEKDYASVTTIISKFEDKSFLKVWRKRVGEEEANRIMVNASSLGTWVHKANELYFTHPDSKYLEYTESLEPEVYQRHTQYLPILNSVTVLGHQEVPLLEQKLICEVKVDDEMYGFGGTPDLVGTFSIKKLEQLLFVNHHLKKNIEKEQFFTKEDIEKGYITFVADYKNWRGNTKGNADLLKTFLQLSAYMILVNQFVEEPYKVRNGFIFGTTGDGKLAIYYLNFNKMVWYGHWFLHFCKAFYKKETLSWSAFKDHSFNSKVSNYKPTRFYVSKKEDPEDANSESDESTPPTESITS